MSSHLKQKRQHIVRMVAFNVILTAALALGISSSANAHATDGPLDYIIINHQSLEGPALDDLLALKTAQGYSFQQYTVTDGVGRDAIRGLIRSVYHSTDYCPLYLLIVGSAKRDESGNDSIADASVNNLVPTFYSDDVFGHRTAYDQWYAYMSDDDVACKQPRMIVGRIPARSTTELQNYVDKLVEYDADVLDAPWKRRVFLVAGDKYRGEFPDFPSAVAVNNNINSLYGLLPTGFPGTIMRYSDYGDAAARKQAFVQAVNSGKGLIAGLTTGSHANNFAYIIERLTFDAGVDFSNNGHYPVFLASSCNLAQIDIDFGEGEQDLPENLLLAPSRGVIGIIGPTGSSSDFSNAYYLHELFNRLFNRGITGIGNLNVATGLTLKNHRGHPDTYNMTSVLGDPGLPVPSRWYGLDDRVFEANMELTEALPFQDCGFYLGSGIEDTRAGVVKKNIIYGRRSYRIEGYDNESDDPMGLWTLYENVGVVIDSSTRFLTYYVKPLAHPEGIGRFGVECIVDGVRLDSYGIVDQYGQAMDLLSRNVPLGRHEFYAFDLEVVYGKTVEKVLVGYNSLNNNLYGDFAAIFDDIKLSATWGFPPDVGSIQMPSLVLTGSTVDVSLSAEDQDEMMFGDALSVEWTVSYGNITGEGFEVVYHAPSQVGYDRTLTANVTDKGGHTVTRTKTFDVVDELPACPHLFVWDGAKYVNQGAVLTRSRLDDKGSFVFDALPFFSRHVQTDGVFRFALREDGSDVTSLEKVTLSLVELEREAGSVGITLDGRVLHFSDPVPPGQCIDDQDFDQLQKVRASDGKVFRAYGPGHLILRYRKLFAPQLPKPGKFFTDGGGPGIPPPDKKLDKIAALSTDPDNPNYVSVSIYFRGEGWKEIERLAPQSNVRFPRLLDLLPYVDSTGGLWVKIAWTWNFSADDLSFYRFSGSGITEIQPRLSNATHISAGEVTSPLLANDGQWATLEPGQEIILEFESVTPKRYDLGVMKLWGKYEPSSEHGGELTETVSDPGSDEVLLSQNMPNPFNAYTRMTLNLPHAGNARLTIYNVLGQRVRVIVDDYLSEGDHEFAWKGRDDNGRPLSSGTYFYALNFDGLMVSRKMILLK